MPDIDQSEIVEEYYENQPTDVEAEDSESRDPIKPWDPDLIRISTMVFSLFQIIDQLKDGDLDLAPDFQRRYVWKPKQKSRLIESILLGIPLPSFYFNQDKSGRMQVVDGVQRLTTISDFEAGRFSLSGLEYLESQTGKSFKELDGVYRRRFKATQIFASVIDPQTPPPVKFDVFRRINTGGSPLNGQEIRHCISGERARSFLKQCADAAILHEVTGGTLENHVRMADREVVLRFAAFSLNEQEYSQAANFDSFLTSALDDLEKMSDGELDELKERFLGAVRLAGRLFGEYSFRKWPTGESKKYPINRALFEAWTVALSEVDPECTLAVKERLVTSAREAMKKDSSFIQSISQSTGDPRKVEKRFETVRKLVAEALGDK